MQAPTRAEEYIIDESPEVSLGENSLFSQKIFQIFPALKNKNYQIYFAAGLVSLIGTWLQIVAEAALIVYVLRPSHTALWVGIDGVAATLPTLLFSLYGGVIVDRLPKRNILLFTQSAAMVLAFVYGVLTLLHLITIFEIIFLAFLLGVVTALDTPARQAFVSKIVSKEELSSAIALSSGVFNVARVVGPALAGIFTAMIGAGGVFLLNGISYIPIIIGIYLMDIEEVLPQVHPSPLKAIKEGITYSFHHSAIRTLLAMVAIVSIFGWSYSTMLPIFAKSIFHLSPTGLGSLYVAGSIGALLASAVLSAFSKKKRVLYFILGGAFLFSISIFLFSFVDTLEPALILLFFAGFGLIAQYVTLNSTVQHLVKDELRGRVLSIYALFFLGFLSIGNFEVGILSNMFTAQLAIRIGAIVVFISGVVLFLQRDSLHKYIQATG